LKKRTRSWGDGWWFPLYKACACRPRAICI
jgi:hypothetical protein